MRKILATVVLFSSFVTFNNSAMGQDIPEDTKADIVASVKNLKTLQGFFTNGGTITATVAASGILFYVGSKLGKTSVTLKDSITYVLKEQFQREYSADRWAPYATGKRPFVWECDVKKLSDLAPAYRNVKYLNKIKYNNFFVLKETVNGETVGYSLDSKAAGQLYKASVQSNIAGKALKGLGIITGVATIATALYYIYNSDEGDVTSATIDSNNLKAAATYDLSKYNPGDDSTIPAGLIVLLQDEGIRGTINSTHAIYGAAKEGGQI